MGIILIIIGVVGFVIHNVRIGGVYKNMSSKDYLIIALWLIIIILGAMNL